MNKKDRKEQMRQETKENVSFLDWYENERKYSKMPFFKVVIWVLLLIVCIVGTQEWTISKLGKEASKYNEGVYDTLKSAIEDSIKLVEIDGKKLHSIDEDALFEGLDYADISYSKDTGKSVSCSIVDGLFTANIRAFLDNKSEIISTERNFKSVDEYLHYYWLVFRGLSYGIGFGIFLVIVLLWNGLLRLIAFIAQKLKERKEKRAAEADSSSSKEEIPNEEPSPAGLLPVTDANTISAS